MPNNLTGEFDVVAEFAIPAANRLLAAMHRCERLLHSISVRVDDNPPPGSKVKPVIVGAVDSFGEVIVNQNQVGKPNPWPGPLAATDPVYSGLDLLVNTNLAGAFDPPVVPSHLQGVAQLQLAPPTIEVPDASGANITVRMPIMSRYFPDLHTAPAAQFVRGELQITAAVAQVVSQAANVNMVEIDIKADNVYVNFSAPFSSPTLSAEDLAGINLLIRNALRTSFLPSNATLPDKVKHLQFKTLLGAQSAIGVLLNMGVAKGAPASLNNNFLGGGDDFALGLNKDFILAAFDSVISKIRNQPIPPVKVHKTLLGTATYTITISQVTAELQNGKIVLTITGSASGNRWWSPNFDFTAQLEFTLSADGDTVQLVPGDISVDTTSTLVNTFAKGDMIASIQNARDAALTQKDADGKDAFRRVNDLLSADKNLGQFLKSLLNPAHPQPGVPPPQDVFMLLWYNSLEITPSGIVLHGSLAVADWPPAHVEYQPIPANTGVGPGEVLPHGPDYSALKTWIPGGAIQQYEWSSQGQTQPFHVDVNQFVLLDSGPQVVEAAASTGAVSGYTPLCLTVKGLRLSSSGPVVAQPVTATMCGYNSFPVVNGLSVALNEPLAMVALTQRGPDGMLQVAGHTSAQVDRTGRGTPNLIVYFADEKSADNLEFLTQALRESGRTDATTAVLAVLTPGQMTKARYTQGIIYGDSQGGAWERVFGANITRRPTTLIVSPKGNVAWQHAGELDAATLAAALRKNLAAGGSVRRDLLGLNLRIGRQAPNFLFELAPGHGLTLRKLVGQSVILVFWKSTLKPSMEAVRDLQKTIGKAAGQGPVVLAINDGEAPELAKKAAAENGLSATVVADPERKISLVYGVSIWPTMVFLDMLGLVRGIRFGRSAGGPVASPTGQKPAASR
jgi:cytochrome c biogenesis protein CcmG, thiol:disulfide interchange protein DsbE